MAAIRGTPTAAVKSGMFDSVIVVTPALAPAVHGLQRTRHDPAYRIDDIRNTAADGVLNIGIEGTILLGALTSFLISFLLGSPWLGVLGAILVGMIFSLFLAWMYVDVKANQVVVGIIFNLLALGLTSYAFRAILGTQARPQKAAMPGLSDPK